MTTPSSKSNGSFHDDDEEESELSKLDSTTSAEAEELEEENNIEQKEEENSSMIQSSSEEQNGIDTRSNSTLPSDPLSSSSTETGERKEKEPLDVEELKSHIGEIAAKVSHDVEAMEAQNSKNSKGIPGAVIIPVSKHDKLLKTVFGFTIHCKCLINDEVRMTIWILAVVATMAGIAFFIADVQLNSISASDLRLDERYLAITIAGVFAFLATILSIVQIRAHYAHWVHPPSQKCVVRILLMVPVYAISAWLSLVFLKWSAYIDFTRMCYEAFVIYTFMILLTKYLGGHNGVVEWMKGKPALHWPAPFCCFMPVTPGSSYLYWLKYGTLQYTILSPIISLLAVTLSFFNLYGDGEVDWTMGYVYIAIVQNFSQLTSLYCLVWLYTAMKQELNPFSPLYKFLVVKSVVFFTWWQSIGIAFLFKYGILTGTGQIDIGATGSATEQSNELQIGLQDFIVCIEMFIAAAAHRYTFGVETYANGTMQLLMDQRAMYLAEVSYKRAKEEQLKEQIRLEVEKRLHEDEGEGMRKRRKNRKLKVDANGEAEAISRSESIDSSLNEDAQTDVDMSNPLVAAAVKEAARQIVEDEDEDVVGDEESEIFTTTPTPAAAIKILSHPPKVDRRTSFRFDAKNVNKPSATGTSSPGTLARTQSSLKVVGDELGKVGQGLEKGAKTVIATTKKFISPVTNFFIDEDSSALFDEDVHKTFQPSPSDLEAKRIELAAVRRRSSGSHVPLGDFSSAGSTIRLISPSEKKVTEEKKEDDNPFNKV